MPDTPLGQDPATLGLNAAPALVMTLSKLVETLQHHMAHVGPACPVHCLNLQSAPDPDLDQAVFQQFLERLAKGDCKMDVAPIYNGSTDGIIGLVLGYHAPVVRPDGQKYEPPCLRL